MAWQYQTVPASNGQINMNGQVVNIQQMLNIAGSENWELAVVVPVAPGVLEFVFKRPA
jgi:poly-beta-hydroxyalkanoate depolymerase